MVERIARALITVGGIGTIVAVTMILVFLVHVVVPLFQGATLDEAGRYPSTARPAYASIDEYRHLWWQYEPAGDLVAGRLGTGAVLERRRLLPGSSPTAFAFSGGGGQAVFGFADGSIRLARIGFAGELLDPAEVTAAMRALRPGEVLEEAGAIVEFTSSRQFRRFRLQVSIEEPLRGAHPSAVRLLDVSASAGGTSVLAFHEGGPLALHRVREKKNLMTGETKRTLVTAEIPFRPPGGRGPPSWLFLGGGGETAFLLWKDGLLQRHDLRDVEHPRLAEVIPTLARADAHVTAASFLLGKTTLMVGDSTGEVHAWFGTKPETPETEDGVVLRRAKRLPGPASPVTALAPSERSRLLAVGHADGTIAIFNVTNERLLCRERVEGGAVATLAIAPKEDGLLALSPAEAREWHLDPGHPEAGLPALLTRVWYEGYPGPGHVWQAVGGTDDFEAKLGMWPLIFGTLKATIYSMLFGAPLAILAAIYTSEFLAARTRSRIKSLVEVMASLPSVVLGFLAALVIAPFAQNVVPAILAFLFLLPLLLLLAARLWQLLPPRLTLRLAGWPRMLAIGGVVLGTLLLAGNAGRLLEELLFDGRMMEWLDNPAVGTPTGGWMLLLVPLGAVATAMLFGATVVPWARRVSTGWDRRACGLLDLGKFLAGAACTVAIAWTASRLLSLGGLDARGAYLGTYVQRNSLVVGFVMGFAIIPIIYTLAEDALNSVPEHLRHASLGAGATPWQTAVRIILPTAFSGIFSAVMVGFGRAVGETMIVLMATGNTPVLDWSIFSGFRTLSANIAVELPEAVRNSTHYRTLFLAALALFAITFVLNTAAEMVRQRFRKRAHQL